MGFLISTHSGSRTVFIPPSVISAHVSLQSHLGMLVHTATVEPILLVGELGKIRSDSASVVHMTHGPAVTGREGELHLLKHSEGDTGPRPFGLPHRFTASQGFCG